MKHHFDSDDKTTVSYRIISRDGKTRYAIMVDGSRRRVDAKPWHGKSERRNVLKTIRDDGAE